MGGKKKIDPATGLRMKYPSDFKKRVDKKGRVRKPRTKEQNAARAQKGMDRDEIRPNKNTKVHF